MQANKLLLLLALVLAGSACQKAPSNQMILFMVKEEGVEPYQTRIIVTPSVIRFDDGEGAATYLLFDRKTRTARNIDTEKHTIMELYTKSVKIDPPFALTHTTRDLGDMKDAPTIKGKKPKHFQDLTNEQLCYDVIAIRDLMPEAVTAMQEFQELLASDSAVTFNDIPADLQDPCEMAMSTFAPTRYLQHGFPIQQWRGGYSRVLTDFNERYNADPNLFDIPAGYFTFSVQQLRDGLVDFEKREILIPPGVNQH